VSTVPGGSTSKPGLLRNLRTSFPKWVQTSVAMPHIIAVFFGLHFACKSSTASPRSMKPGPKGLDIFAAAGRQNLVDPERRPYA